MLFSAFRRRKGLETMVDGYWTAFVSLNSSFLT